MPRKGHIAKRTVPADAVYQSDLVTKFINSMMWQGKRSTAEGIFYEALTKLESKGGDEALKLFKKAVENAKPLLEVKTRRVGGANYQVPVEVNADRRTSLGIRWIITYARSRGEKLCGQVLHWRRVLRHDYTASDSAKYPGKSRLVYCLYPLSG